MGVWLGEGRGGFVSFRFDSSLEFRLSVQISCDVYAHNKKV